MKKLLFLAMTAFAVSALGAQTQEVNYADKKGLGDKAFVLDLGADLPLFFQDMDGNTSPTNLSTGGLLGMSMEGYLNNDFRLGGGFKLNFSVNPNGKYLFDMPLFASATYEYKAFPFRVNGTMEAGGILLSYENEVRFDPFLAPGVTLNYQFDPRWSAGLNTRYWWVPQFYLGSEVPFEQSRFGNFLELSLAFTYTFF